MIKDENMEQDVDKEKVPARSQLISSKELTPEAAAGAQVKLEKVFDWSGIEKEEDGNS